MARASKKKRKPAPGVANSRPNRHHAVNLTNYIFNVGYMGQQWADVQLTFFETGLKLHRSMRKRRWG